MSRTIRNTDEVAQHPWPAEVFIQGGTRGAVFTGKGNYRTAFFEAFPGESFLRGEGKTIREAEDSCWGQYKTYRDCDGTGTGHGPFERRQYRNGAGFCTRCGTWMSGVLEELPPETPRARRRPLMERALTEPDVALAVLETVAHVEDLPEKPTA